MSTPQNTIAIVYDYDQTLSPSYMQDEVVFPAFGIDPKNFWRRCTEFVREQGYDSELAYMKVLLDTLGMDRPTNDELRQLGAKLNFYKGLPEMFDDFRDALLSEEQIAHGIAVEHYIISSGMKVLIEGSRLAPYVRAIFGCEFARTSGAGLRFRSASSATRRKRSSFRRRKMRSRIPRALLSGGARGDLDRLRQIASDPHGFILRQGWASLDFREEEHAARLAKLLESLEISSSSKAPIRRSITGRQSSKMSPKMSMWSWTRWAKRR